jgi:hypothetical protein
MNTSRQSKKAFVFALILLISFMQIESGLAAPRASGACLILTENSNEKYAKNYIDDSELRKQQAYAMQNVGYSKALAIMEANKDWLNLPNLPILEIGPFLNPLGHLYKGDRPWVVWDLDSGALKNIKENYDPTAHAFGLDMNSLSPARYRLFLNEQARVLGVAKPKYSLVIMSSVLNYIDSAQWLQRAFDLVENGGSLLIANSHEGTRKDFHMTRESESSVPSQIVEFLSKNRDQIEVASMPFQSSGKEIIELGAVNKNQDQTILIKKVRPTSHKGGPRPGADLLAISSQMTIFSNHKWQLSFSGGHEKRSADGGPLSWREISDASQKTEFYASLEMYLEYAYWPNRMKKQPPIEILKRRFEKIKSVTDFLNDPYSQFKTMLKDRNELVLSQWFKHLRTLDFRLAGLLKETISRWSEDSDAAWLDRKLIELGPPQLLKEVYLVGPTYSRMQNSKNYSLRITQENIGKWLKRAENEPEVLAILQEYLPLSDSWGARGSLEQLSLLTRWAGPKLSQVIESRLNQEFTPAELAQIQNNESLQGRGAQRLNLSPYKETLRILLAASKIENETSRWNFMRDEITAYYHSMNHQFEIPQMYFERPI